MGKAIMTEIAVELNSLDIMRVTYSLIVVSLFFISCQNVLGQTPTLKTKFKDSFLIGTALGNMHLNETNAKANELIASQFSVITPENVMKSKIIHPEWDRFDFSMSDKVIALANKHKMEVIGHTLIWHSQLSPFITESTPADSVRLFMQNHIKTIGNRYDGKLLGWDVVNEALNEDGTLRNTVFLQKIGEQYLVDAFKYAQEATPNSELYYNDYNIEKPLKRAGAIELVKRLKAAGVRIDGIGIQGHWNIANLPLQHIEESILAFHELGLQVMITELDLTVLPNPSDLKGAEISQNFEERKFMNPYIDGLPTEVEQKLADTYKSLFELFLKHSDKISRITFWGVNDGQSWLNNFPIKNRTNYPLLFDRDFQPKKAYHAVMNLK